MQQMEFLFGNIIPEAISKRLDTSGLSRTLFGAMPEAIDSDCLVKDVVHADGTPVVHNSAVIYPRYTGWYLGTPIASTYLDVKDGYRFTAAKAAIKWIRALLPDVTSPEPKHYNGETITISMGGEDFKFCVPDTCVSFIRHPGGEETVPVIAFPDTRDNDEDWSNGCIPLHVEQQALLTLWLLQTSYENHRRSSSPTRAFVVRITGNTAGDIVIRTVKSDTRKISTLLTRVCKAVSKARANGIDPLQNMKKVEMDTWFEKKAEDRSMAYQVNDDNFRELLRKYMSARSERKTLEAQSDALSEQMKCIAIELASMTSCNAKTGSLIVSPDKKFTVTHSVKSTREPTISAKLLQEFYPELTDVVSTTTTPRGKVDINVI